MKSIFCMAWKDLLLIRRDWLGLFFMFVFPIGLGIFMGMMFQSSGDTPSAMRVGIVDEDNTSRSARFRELMTDSEQIDLENMELEAARESVRKGNLAAVIVIPAGFGETAGLMWSEEPTRLQIAADPSRTAESGMLEGFMMQAMGALTMERFQDPASTLPAIEDWRSSIATAEDLSPAQQLLLGGMMDSLEQFLSTMAEVQTSQADATDGNMPDFQLAEIEQLAITRGEEDQSILEQIGSSWNLSFPSAMMWGVLGCTAGFAISLVRERGRGTLLRLQAAPVSRSQIIAGKATACYLGVIAVLVVMVPIGCLLGMSPGNFPLLILAALCIAFCFVGVMMAMSVIGKTEEAVGGGGWGVNIVMAMFGGGMVPLIFMPPFMQTLSNFSPVKWSILALEGAIWRDFSVTEMLLPCAVLIGFGTVGLTIGAVVLSRAKS